jgi:HSP20 family protein
MRNLHHDLDRIFERRVEDNTTGTLADWSPAVDIREEEQRFVIHADVPGVGPDNIEITMEDGVLTLTGIRETQNSEDTEGFTRVERIHGRFHRRFTLPETVDAEAIEARFQNGVLEMVIPKLPRVQPRRIEVRTA